MKELEIEFMDALKSTVDYCEACEIKASMSADAAQIDISSDFIEHLSKNNEYMNLI